MTNPPAPPFGRTGTVLVLGGTSAIARSVASEFAARRFDVILAGREIAELETIAADLRLRHSVAAVPRKFDALAFESHPAFVEECRTACGNKLVGAVVCFGYLGDQAEGERNFEETRRIFDTNLLGAVSILNPIARHLEEKREGFVAAISSVAGDRGRRSNFLYGAAKAGLTVYLQGLRNRLSGSGVRVVTIKPGFVDTRMTYGRPGMFLVASPEAVGRRIVRAILSGKDVTYVPGFWRFVMFGIRAIPERVFKKTRT
jgi:short-subunit dehydrogenase